MAEGEEKSGWRLEAGQLPASETKDHLRLSSAIASTTIMGTILHCKDPLTLHNDYNSHSIYIVPYMSISSHPLVDERNVPHQQARTPRHNIRLAWPVSSYTRKGWIAFRMRMQTSQSGMRRAGNLLPRDRYERH